MAYRFLLEVPETLADEANVVVSHAGKAQVTVVRDSHGTGFDMPTKDLTISAHGLGVIESLYQWYADTLRAQPLQRAPMRIALHSGERLSFGEVGHDQMVAAIRRDQPWVDHTIPKIGDHETKESPGGSAIASHVVAVEDFVPESDQVTPPHVNAVTILATDEKSDHPSMMVEGVPALLLPVIDLAKPERMYAELFGAELMARGKRNDHGAMDYLGPQYDIEQEAQRGDEPDFAFLQNGPLTIALERMGRGYPLDVFRVVPDPIHLLMDTRSIQRVKAQVLMRGFNVFRTADESFGFRDPFGYTWQLHDDAHEGAR